MILVTGGAGFIGSNLVDKLVDLNYNVLVIDDLSSGFESNIKNIDKVKFIKKNLNDIQIDDLPKIRFVYHLSAQTSVPKSVKEFYKSSSNNLLSSLWVFNLVIKRKIPLIYASSSSVYGNLPVGNDLDSNFDILSPYALDKLTLEKYSKLLWDIYDIPSIGFRFFNVYGPKQDPNSSYSGVISIFIRNLIKGENIKLNGGHQTRDFIYVDDVVSVLIKSIQKLSQNKNNYIFNLGTGVSTRIDFILSKLIKISKKNPKIEKYALDKSDPVKSLGSYNKLNDFFNLDLKNFKNLDFGLEATYNYIKKYYEKI